MAISVGPGRLGIYSKSLLTVLLLGCSSQSTTESLRCDASYVGGGGESGESSQSGGKSTAKSSKGGASSAVGGSTSGKGGQGGVSQQMSIPAAGARITLSSSTELKLSGSNGGASSLGGASSSASAGGVAAGGTAGATPAVNTVAYSPTVVSSGTGYYGFYTLGSDHGTREFWYTSNTWLPTKVIDSAPAPAAAALDGAVLNGGATIVLVSLDRDSHLVMRTYAASTATWSTWQTVSRDLIWNSPPAIASDVSLATAYVVATDAQHLWVRSTDGYTFGSWSTLTTTTVPTTTTSVSHPDAAIVKSGSSIYLQVVVRDQAGKLLFGHFPYLSGRFVAAPLTDIKLTGSTVGAPCISATSLTNTDLFVRNASNQLLHAYTTDAGKTWAGSNATTWLVHADKTATTDPDCTASVVTAGSTDGRLHWSKGSNGWTTWDAI